MKILQSLKPTVPYLLIFAICLCAFSNLRFSNFLTLDDPFLVLSNPIVQSFDLRAIWFSPLIGLYHPLTTMSWAIDYALWGADARAFHLSNIFYHIINCFLVYFFLVQLLKRQTWVALFITVLFAIHPIKVETVAWISARKDLIFTLFYLLGLIAYQRYLRASRFRFLLLTVLAFILSLLSKPMAVSFPVVIYLLDLWHDPKLWGKRLLQKLPFLLISVAFAIGNAIAQRNVSNISGSFVSIDSFLRATKGLLLSFTLLFQPNSLCGFYDQKTFSLGQVDYLIISLYLIVLLVVCCTKIRFLRPIFLLNASFVIITMPALKLVGFGDDSITNDRYLYLSSLGLFIGLGLALEAICNQITRFRTLVHGLIMGISVFSLTFCCWQLIPHWSNTVSFWQRVATINSTSPRPYAMLGSYYLNYGPKNQAAINFRKAYQIEPKNISVAALFGLTLVELKQLDEAKKIFTEALLLAPNDAELFASIGNYLIETKDYSNAEKVLKEALKGSPRITSIENSSVRFRSLTSLGVLYLRTNRLDEAKLALETATAMNYDDALSYYHLGYYYSQVGRWQDAVKQYQRTIQLNPNVVDAYIGLGISYWNLKQQDLSQQFFMKAVAIGPNHSLAHGNLAEFYRQTNNFELAKKHYFKALELDPTFTQVHQGLAAIYQMEGNNKETDYHLGEIKKRQQVEN